MRPGSFITPTSISGQLPGEQVRMYLTPSIITITAMVWAIMVPYAARMHTKMVAGVGDDGHPQAKALICLVCTKELFLRVIIPCNEMDQPLGRAPCAV